MLSSKNNSKSTSVSRSRLYNIEPIGIGTPYVESLWSYISRVASHHCVRVGDLLEYIIIEKLEMTISEFYNKKNQINKFGSFTENLISIIENLTSRNDLRYLTLRKWENALKNKRSIVNLFLKWCPKCLTDFRNNKLEIYEPLIWSIKCLKICSKHKVELSSICPICKKSHYSFTKRARPGFCPHCEQWLGETSFKVVTGGELERQLMLSKSVGDVLSQNNSEMQSATKEEILISIKKIVEITTNGNVKEFSKLANKSREQVYKWLRGAEPEFESLIDICEVANIKVVDLLLNRIDYSFNIKVNNIPKVNRKRKTYDRDLDEIERQLEDFYLNEYPPISVSEIQRRLNYFNIYRKYPQLSKKISYKYQEYRKTQAELNLMHRVEEVKTIIKEIHNNSKYPSERLVKSKMKDPIAFIDPIIRKTYKSMLRELGLK
ncbi:TniQ family protein [Peribacillus frigoritolerans]|uniref:TniQ family protein n=1 Tax=Peribacillus frigoritolerans TaxID=450367 RepID=UPI0023DBCE1B|nr:TniQ family protein [Peribacillus frigoritolerans]MDF2000225.1 TniQ family protein [Peribacillus frigoritolerans]